MPKLLGEGRKLPVRKASERPKFARTATLAPVTVVEKPEESLVLENPSITIDHAENGSVVRVSGQIGDEYVSKNFIATSQEEINSIVQGLING